MKAMPSRHGETNENLSHYLHDKILAILSPHLFHLWVLELIKISCFPEILTENDLIFRAFYQK